MKRDEKLILKNIPDTGLKIRTKNIKRKNIINNRSLKYQVLIDDEYTNFETFPEVVHSFPIYNSKLYL